MSLEQAITRNNELLEQLIRALSVQILINKEGTPQAAETKTKAKDTVKKETIKPEAKVEETPPVETKEEPTTAPLTYQETAKWVIRVSNEISRECTVDILARFGLKTLKEAKPEQFAALVEKCKTALATGVA